MNKINLDGKWKLTCDDGKEWETQVPGSVLGTLLQYGDIPDPYDGMNEYDILPVLEKTYTFEREFSVTKEDIACAHLDLVFDGIDTIADIFLNGAKIASVKNMHRIWRFDVRNLVRTGDNHLKLIIYPAITYIRKAAEENPDVTYWGGSCIRWTGSLRKAHYMFGWDWGPRLPDAGIWRSVRLEAYESRLDNIRIHQEHEDGKVTLTVAADTDAPEISVSVFSPEGETAASGKGNGSAVLTVKNPELWWPNGLGDQPLYTVKIEAVKGQTACDEKTMRIGLRTLTVSTDKDEWGSEFALCVNGVKFFAMGADYIPEDNILSRMNPELTRKLLNTCKDSNFNCIRVWGGGIYPDDSFFDACDELGLVVWMDMMFACNVYKLTDEFKEEMIREAEDNLRRIRHHACLGLICGNNEMELAWVDWTSVKYESEELKAQYTEEFEVIMKEAAQREAPDLFYWPSSPSSTGHFENPNDFDRGDTHDWSVWHGGKPFTAFTEHYHRFCSEFGFESFPCMETLKTFIHDEKDMNPFSEVMESHQKCFGGNRIMLNYLSESFKYPYSMEKLVYCSQYLQAEAMRAGVEHWRRNRGRCMGAIYWQLNDCWPVASWASIDSLGNQKALQYEAKRFFAPVLVSIRKGENGYIVNVSNERREGFRGTVTADICSADGTVISSECFRVDIAPMSAADTGTVSDLSAPLLHCVLTDENGNFAGENEVLSKPPKHFPYAEPKLTITVSGDEVTAESDVYCPAVALHAGNAQFSDNWFSLYPGKPKKVKADRVLSQNELTALCLSSDQVFR